MQNKQKRRNGIITKFFSIIFSMILLFSMTIPALAFDGEIGSPVDKEMLESYLPKCDVLFNPSDLPLYSPFNHETLYWTLKWPIAADTDDTANFHAVSDEYLAITTESGGIYTTYYLIPATQSGALHEFFHAVFSCSFSDLYEDVFTYDSTITNNKLKVNKSYSTILGLFSQSNSESKMLNGYLYSTTRSSENTMLSISQISMGMYIDCYFSLPTSDIVQIYWYSASSTISDSSVDDDFDLKKSVRTLNLNYLVSTSTYSVTAYDYFDDVDNLLGFFSSDVKFTYNYSDFTTAKSANLVTTIPEAIRGPNCPDDGKVSLVPDNTSFPFYLSDDIFNKDKSFLMIPMYVGNSTRFNVLFYVFPDDSESLIYFKYLAKGVPYRHSYSSSADYMTYQVLSKIDYDLYINNLKIGSFDAETTTYNSIAYGYQNDFHLAGVVLEPYLSSTINNINTTTIKKNQSYKCYPYITFAQVFYGYAFPLSFVHGNRAAFSLFRDSNNMGFYTYVSPDINENVLIGGNSGNPLLPPSGGGSGGSDDDFWKDTDKLQVDYDGILKMELPDAPTFDIDRVDFSNILELPDTFIIFLIDCIDWFTLAFDEFINTYMSPVSIFFKMIALIFAYIPDFLKFLFLFVILSSLMLKVLQYSTASVSTIDTMTGGD